MPTPSNPKPTETSERPYQKLSAQDRKKLGQVVEKYRGDLKMKSPATKN